MHSNNRTILDKIIYANLLFFIIINVVQLFAFLYQIEIDTGSYLGFSSDIKELIKKPWTIITCMFLHQNILHLIFNIFWLYFSGKIFIRYLNKNELLATYLMSGLSGLILYSISLNSLGAFNDIKDNLIAYGASASVMGILVASATHIPNHNIPLYLIPSRIKLKHIALIYIILDIISIPIEKTGLHFAHLGGALYGYVYIILYRKGMNTNSFFNKFILFFSLKKMRIREFKRENDYEYNARIKNIEKETNRILDKINLSGYDSLSIKEKEHLYNQK
ncbi:MAG: hypothetical protein CMP65_02360 [Flavobacteriales bacterium]|nr:hypothetical protein [Flavobacteriales bacterium]|tara:strand:+ start:45045 stop:45875 length:831 start_codon:yes stop_codon:yes gene_type:complete